MVAHVSKPFNPNRSKHLVQRYEGNPILQGNDFPGDIWWVFNSGVIKVDNRYIMVSRVEDSSLNLYMWVSESSDGIHFTPRPEPVKMPEGDPEFDRYAGWTYWDPRITKLEDTYYIVVAAHSHHGCRLGLFRTYEFERFEWMGCISEPDNRNGVLFPKKIGGMYARLDRPNLPANGAGDIWISYSPDLIHWGRSEFVIGRDALKWSWTKIGPGVVPIETDEGWLTIFHAVRTQCNGHYNYMLGVMLLDLQDPRRVIALSDRQLLSPMKEYELTGNAPSVVFTNGAIVEDDGSIKLYYGAADSVTCLGFTSVSELLAACKEG